MIIRGHVAEPQEACQHARMVTCVVCVCENECAQEFAEWGRKPWNSMEVGLGGMAR